MTPSMLRWVERELQAKVEGSRRMKGGITSDVHRVSIRTRSGATTTVVLRQWRLDEPLSESAHREARALRLLEPTPVPAPRLLAVTDGTDTGGINAVLMSRVAGSVQLAPRNADDWLRQIAAVLPEIHRLDFEFPAYRPARRASPDDDLSWVADRDLWRRALALVEHGPPPGTRTFAHADFQHFNLLWSRQKLTGVVDWAYPVVSSPDLDAAHCRLNLVVLFSHDLAERFRAAYESEAGRKMDPWWDLYKLAGFTPAWQEFIPVQVAGRVPVDVAGMPARVETALRATLQRLWLAAARHIRRQAVPSLPTCHDV